MKCRYCGTDIAVDWSVESKGYTGNSNHEPEEESAGGYKMKSSNCPKCDGLIIKIEFGLYASPGSENHVHNTHESEILYPIHATPEVDDRIDEPYSSEFANAINIKSISPKASAMLSRRVMEAVLEKEYDIDDGFLSSKISEFISYNDIPYRLRKSVDIVREVGNVGAHTQEDAETGELVDVDPGEADVVLDVLRQLLEYTFVRDERREEQIRSINDKLDRIGRDPLMQPEDAD